MTILGIDPGVTGAIAHFADGKLIQVFDIPFRVESSVHHKKRVDILALVECFSLFAEHPSQVTVYLERAQPMPHEGVSSSFNYGRTNGLIEGALAGLGIFTVNKVASARWKRILHLLGNGLPKNADLERARKLYPHAPLNLQKHHNRADAILIGHYGCLMEGLLK